MSQAEEFDPESTVLDALFTHDSEIGQLIKRYEHALATGSDDLEQLVQQIEDLNARDYETNVRIVINKLHLTELLDRQVGQCSGGETKRLALAKLLINDPDFLILDEPTNHLDMQMIERLETYLRRSKRTILIVTHDRYFLQRICDRILELDATHLYSYPGNYFKFLENKQRREESEDKQRHHMKQILRKELEWMRKAPRARETKSVLRTKQFLKLESDYKQIKHEERQKLRKVEISLQERRLGGKIVNVHNLCKAFDSKVIADNFTYSFRAGERVGLIGRNGVGKTTFIKMLMGQDTPDSGSVKIGSTITTALYQQQHEPIDTNKKVIDIIRDVAEYITI